VTFNILPRGLMLMASIALGACAHSPVDEPSDPLEPVNRAVYGFNEQLDNYVAKPVAKGYNVLPEEIRTGVRNFLRNLSYPTVIVNDALQGKIKQSGLDTTRFVLNSTFGLVGFLDPATMVGLERHDEDFGQTLGYWGVGPGWYLMIPFLGPSSNRDLVGRVGSAVTSPMTYAGTGVSVPVTGLSFVDTRAQLLGVEGVLEQQLDRYVFVRSAYLQRRQSLVYDGNPPREEIDYGDDAAPAPPLKR
jgi:phospholipid-binding lipoprotein MlaA